MPLSKCDKPKLKGHKQSRLNFLFLFLIIPMLLIILPGSEVSTRLKHYSQNVYIRTAKKVLFSFKEKQMIINIFYRKFSIVHIQGIADLELYIFMVSNTLLRVEEILRYDI